MLSPVWEKVCPVHRKKKFRFFKTRTGRNIHQPSYNKYIFYFILLYIFSVNPTTCRMRRQHRSTWTKKRPRNPTKGYRDLLGNADAFSDLSVLLLNQSESLNFFKPNIPDGRKTHKSYKRSAPPSQQSNPFPISCGEQQN